MMFYSFLIIYLVFCNKKIMKNRKVDNNNNN